MNVTLGKIVGVFGVKGWVKVFSETRPREQIFKYSPWLLVLNGDEFEVEVLEGRQQGKGLIASLKGYTDCEDARKLVGSEILVSQESLPKTGKNEYYWSQLTGLNVVNLQGIELGKVVNLFETGANDVLVVKGEKERLIPFTEFAVIDVDIDSNNIVVDWDEDF
ncbi:MAG: ribosome maturation factor RimM [Arenicellales bacterium]|jgi:16S rRNA processing protein RimM